MKGNRCYLRLKNRAFLPECHAPKVPNYSDDVSRWQSTLPIGNIENTILFYFNQVWIFRVEFHRGASYRFWRV
jgi:hypothetical protein